MPELKRRIVPLLGIAFVVAIIATGVFYGLFVGELKSATTRISNQNVLVATRDLPRGKQLEESDVKVSRWAGAEPLKGAFTNPSQIIGKPLMSNVSQNEPMTESKLSASSSGASQLVPTGMRAVSVRIQESSGLMPFLKPGHRVDIQLVSAANSLRTILENVEVLSISAPTANTPGTLVSVLTLLVTPAEADRAALADATAKLRLVLRNPNDQEATRRPGIELNRALEDLNLSSGSIQTQPRNDAYAMSTGGANRTVTPAQNNRIDFQIRVLGVNDKGLEALRAGLATNPTQGKLTVTSFRQDSNVDKILSQLSDAKQAELLATSNYVSINDRPVFAKPGSAWTQVEGIACGMFLNLQPSANGKSLRLRVQPEVSLPHGSEVESRRTAADLNVESAGSFAIIGWADKANAPVLLEKLFSGKWKNKDNVEPVVIVTPLWGSNQNLALNHKP